MKRVYAEATAEIATDPETLYDLVSDFENHPKIAGSGEVQAVHKSSTGPVKKGDVIQCDQKRDGKEYKTISTINSAERGKSFSWLTGITQKITYGEWKFEFQKLSDKNGQPNTKVTHSFELQPSILAPILKPLLTMVLKKRIEKNAHDMAGTLQKIAKMKTNEEAANVKENFVV